MAVTETAADTIRPKTKPRRICDYWFRP